MNLISNLDSLQRRTIKLKQSGKTIGFVPTMGFLHDGHLSLIKKARQDCDIVVVSIFVNPLQFGPRENFKKYPINLKKDISLCKKYTDILFLPTAKGTYPDNFLSLVEVRKLSDILCGASRPGHFKGVTTVVNKLFNIVLPDIAYFGQKDAQQAIIINKMVEDLNMPIKIKVLSIVRELDGLAMSSRNSYLSSAERKDAVVLYESLILARNLIKNKVSSSKMITAKMRRLILNKKSAKIDYISIVHPVTLAQINNIKDEVLVLLAVFIGKTRLIDNMVVRIR
jgi:pantoate--beta-alanine ligase